MASNSRLQYVPKEKRETTSKKDSKKPESGIPITNQSFVDTHVHLDMILKEEKLSLKDLSKYIKENFSEQFVGCVNVCCFIQGFDPAEHFAKEFTQIFCSYGIHPHAAKDYSQQLEDRILRNMKDSKTVAWGECGLDFFKDFSPRNKQIEVFTRQVQLAVSVQKPLIVHTREAEEDTFKIMAENLPKDWKIHVHCFGDTPEFAKKLLDYFPNLFIGFTGAITFKNSQKNLQVVEIVPLERILLETDGPFMAPVPLRGKTAHSGMIPLVAQKIAEVKKCSAEEVLKQTLLNARKMYGCF